MADAQKLINDIRSALIAQLPRAPEVTEAEALALDLEDAEPDEPEIRILLSTAAEMIRDQEREIRSLYEDRR